MDPPVTALPEPAVETLRIHAAAIVAQESALFERELRIQNRESALARQEEQLAGLLEVKRRQLLNLQDQITAAREDLRQKRAAQDAHIEQQSRELTASRDQAGQLLGEAKAQQQRITRLQSRLRERRRRERQALTSQYKSLVEERARFESERDAAGEALARRTGQVELDKRRVRAAWERLAAERKAWAGRRSAEMADLQRRLRDTARRDKAVRAAENKQASERDGLAKEFSDRRHEIERLETRIGHARQRLLDAQADLIAVPAAAPALVTIPEVALTPRAVDAAMEERTRSLAQIALELSDQRLWLVEQTSRFVRARDKWSAERDASSTELQSLTAALQEKEQTLARRARDVSSSEQRLQLEFDTLAKVRLSLEAEHTRHVAALTADRNDLDRRAALLKTHEQILSRREEQMADVLRIWGRRRRLAIERLNREADGFRAERREWSVARDSWLHEYERVVAERQSLTARTVALEQARHIWLESHEQSPMAAKRLERLERHWVSQFSADVRQLERLRATLAAESLRLDETAIQTRRDRIAAAEQSLAADERLAEVEAARLAIAAERRADDRDIGQSEAAESQVLQLRDEVEGLARLLIDAPATPIDRAA